MTLRLVGITRRFGAQVALENVTVHVRRGDLYGFIGHNGAGKTTAMRIALGLQRPDKGRVIVDGFDAARHPREARARLGALVEICGFHPQWDGERNLRELARLQGMSRTDAQREAGRWLERLGLAHAASKPVVAYSHGMRQRLGIAQALLGTPMCVLLDEPTNGLDPEGIADVRDLLRELVRDHGVSVLVSSHQLSEIAGLCNRIGVLQNGRLLAEEETATLVQAGSSRYRLEVDDRARAVAALAKAGIQPLAGDALVIDLGSRAPVDVSRVLVEQQVGLVAFAPAPQTLEEIYLRLTHTGTPRAQAASSSAADTASVAPRERRAPSAPVRRVSAFDLRRWTATLGVPLLFAAPALVGVLAMARRAAQAAGDTQAIETKKLFSATDVSGFEAVGLALQAALPLLAFLALALGSQSLAAEYARGTLRNLLLRPVTRVQAALGKFGALVVLTCASYALLVCVALGVGRFAFGFGDVTEVLPNGARYTLTKASEIWPQLWSALASPLFPLAAYCGLGFLAGALCRTGAAALGLALGAGVVLDLARAFARALGLAGLLPSDHLPSPLSDTSAIRFYVDVSQGVSNASPPHTALQIGVPMAWALATFMLGTLVLARRSVP